MGRNDIDTDAPASDAVLALDEPAQATWAEEAPPQVGDAIGPRPSSGHRPSPHPAPRRRVGRPTRLTPRLAKALVKLIAQTGRIEPAARRCGIPPSTVTDWIARGRGQHMTRGPNRLNAEFAGSVEKALGQYECDQLAGIQTAAAAKPETWTARAWQLERWAPERYGRREQVNVSGTLTVVEMRALFVGMLQLMERYVPEERREAEAKNLIAVVDELAGGIGGGVVERAPLAPVK
jgi:hypothetical protein